jgi:hypothetical protein
MSWDEIEGTLAEVTARLTRAALAHHVIENAPVDRRLVGHDDDAVAEHRIWWVAEVDAGECGTDRLIMVAQLREFAGGPFAYNLMQEGMGPWCIDCPQELLDLAPTAPTGSGYEHAAEWRDRVKCHNEAMAQMREAVEKRRLERNRRERERCAAKRRNR